VPVIVLSARGDPASRTEARAGGADAFLTKPFHLSELMAAIAALLDRAGSRRDRLRREANEVAQGVWSALAPALGPAARALSGDAGGKAAAPLEQLLRRARAIEAARAEVARPVALDAWLEAAVAGFAPPATVEVALELRAGVDVELREAAARALLGELLANAFEFAGRRARVLVASELAADGRAVVRVEDSGPGIPRAQRERVFAPFFTTAGDGRLGLGLAAARELARGLGGELAVVEPRALGGAAMVFGLPARAREVEVA
jgi:signal transduction histidine kinase